MCRLLLGRHHLGTLGSENTSRATSARQRRENRRDNLRNHRTPSLIKNEIWSSRSAHYETLLKQAAHVRARMYTPGLTRAPTRDESARARSIPHAHRPHHRTRTVQWWSGLEKAGLRRERTPKATVGPVITLTYSMRTCALRRCGHWASWTRQRLRSTPLPSSPSLRTRVLTCALRRRGRSKSWWNPRPFALAAAYSLDSPLRKPGIKKSGPPEAPPGAKK